MTIKMISSVTGAAGSMKLKVRSIRLEADHAAYAWEQKLGTVLEVDVEVSYRKAPNSERLDQAITVEDIVSSVLRVSGKKTYHLIEMLATDILDSFWKRHRAKIQELLVRVRKNRPKSDRRIGGYEVEVTRA